MGAEAKLRGFGAGALPAHVSFLSAAHAQLAAAANPAPPLLALVRRSALDALHRRFEPFLDLGLFQRSAGCWQASIDP